MPGDELHNVSAIISVRALSQVVRRCPVPEAEVSLTETQSTDGKASRAVVIPMRRAGCNS